MTRLTLTPCRLALLTALPLLLGVMTSLAEAKTPCKPHTVKVVVKKVVCDCASPTREKVHLSRRASSVKTGYRLAYGPIEHDPIRQTPPTGDGPTMLLSDGYASSTISDSHRVVITRSTDSDTCGEDCNYQGTDSNCGTICTTVPPEPEDQPCDNVTCGSPDDRLYHDDQAYSDDTEYGRQAPYGDDQTYVSGGGGGNSSYSVETGVAATAVYLRWGNHYRDRDNNDHGGYGDHGHQEGEGQGHNHGGWQGSHDHDGHQSDHGHGDWGQTGNTQGGYESGHQGRDVGSHHTGNSYQGGYSHSGARAGNWQANASHTGVQWHAVNTGSTMSGHRQPTLGHPAYHPRPASAPRAFVGQAGRVGGWHK